MTQHNLFNTRLLPTLATNQSYQSGSVDWSEGGSPPSPRREVGLGGHPPYTKSIIYNIWKRGLRLVRADRPEPPSQDNIPLKIIFTKCSLLVTALKAFDW